MKKLLTFVFLAFLSFNLSSQVSKTQAVETPGTLANLASSYLTTVTSLTITGSIDARDFKTIRDNMPQLAQLNLSEVTIVSYSGTAGTDFNTNSVIYPANEIPAYAFYNPNVTKYKIFATLNLPESITSIGKYAFSYCRSLNKLIIPDSVTTIGEYAFMKCVGLTNINIPQSVTTIGTLAFSLCTGLQSIYVNSKPIAIFWSFQGVSLGTCILNVPYSTKKLYSSAPFWSDFVNIVEANSGFLIKNNNINFSDSACVSTIGIAANVRWAVHSDQSWLTVSPDSANGDITLTLSAEANQITKPRTAIVTVTSSGLPPQTITIKQEEAPTKLTVVPGGLLSALKAADRMDVKSLIVLGSIDARDFKAMRDSLLQLIKLDLSSVTIASYTGTEGPYLGNNITYAANEIPSCAFWNSNKSNFQSSLISVKLPLSLTSIGSQSFYNCTALATITLPATITAIGTQTLSFCKKLTEIKLESGNENFYTQNDVLFNKNQTVLIQYPPAKTDSIYYIPSSITSIAGGAFASSKNLTCITIPQSVTEIGYDAFTDCSGLRSFFMNSEPLELNSTTFLGVSKENCILYVPYHTKLLYTSAVYWKDFTNIVELATAIPKAPFVDNVRAFPYPIVDRLTITGIDENTLVSILDLNGRVLLVRKLSNDNVISLESLSRGQYILRVVNSQGVKNLKISKL